MDSTTLPQPCCLDLQLVWHEYYISCTTCVTQTSFVRGCFGSSAVLQCALQTHLVLETIVISKQIYNTKVAYSRFKT